jgi:hypothetical protein
VTHYHWSIRQVWKTQQYQEAYNQDYTVMRKTHTCRSCGADGTGPCSYYGSNPCDDGLILAKQGSGTMICSSCGNSPFAPACPTTGCVAPYEKKSGTTGDYCRKCGGVGEMPCSAGDGCGSDPFMQPLAGGACGPCGGSWQEICQNGEKCKAGHVEDNAQARCRPCGGSGQPPCIAGGADAQCGHSQLGEATPGAEHYTCNDADHAWAWADEDGAADRGAVSRRCRLAGRRGHVPKRTNTDYNLKYPGQLCQAPWRYVGDKVYADVSECLKAADADARCGDNAMYLSKSQETSTWLANANSASCDLNQKPKQAFAAFGEVGACICTLPKAEGALAECDPRHTPVPNLHEKSTKKVWDTYVRKRCSAGNNPQIDGSCAPCGGFNQDACVDAAGKDECDAGLERKGVTCVPCGNRGQAPCTDASAQTNPEHPGCRAGLDIMGNPAKCIACGNMGQPACHDASGKALCKEADTSPSQVSGQKARWVCVRCGDHNQIACDRSANTLTKSVTPSPSRCKPNMRMNDAQASLRCYKTELFDELVSTGTYDHTPQMKDDMLKNGQQWAAGRNSGGGDDNSKEDDDSSGTALIASIVGVLAAVIVGGAAFIAGKKSAQNSADGDMFRNESADVGGNRLESGKAQSYASIPLKSADSMRSTGSASGGAGQTQI